VGAGDAPRAGRARDRRLLLASATLEAPAGIVDIGAWAGRAAAHAVLGR
jgi:hypothetical protein